MKEFPILDVDTAWKRWRERCSHVPSSSAFAMFSTLWDGIVTDPSGMVVPVDDHLVHRGDGVFETVRCVEGALYALQPHLDRLEGSAAAIGLCVPMSKSDLTAATVAVTRAGARPDAAVRIIVARGPGGFGVNPYDCPAPQVYIVAYACGKPFMQAHRDGARALTSAVPMKPGMLATAKTCNYIPNALMKKEAVDAGVDFSVSFDENGCLGEGATENFAIVDAQSRFRIPPPHRILSGITVRRVAELAARDPARYGLSRVEAGPIERREVQSAREMLIFGTTVEVASVVELDGHPIGDGRPGPVATALWQLLRDDMRRNAEWRTIVFSG